MSSIVSEPLFRRTTPLVHAVLPLAVLLRHAVVANTDVSWGITMAEKVLAGAWPYVDFIEPNPPSYIYLYVLPVIIARLTGLSPELVLDCLVFIVSGISLWVSGR